MPDTFYTYAPHWRWLIVAYFFVGGIAGGSFFLAALLDVAGTSRHRPTVRAGYIVAFVGAVLSGILLVVDLNRPLRFWHMLIRSETGWPMFKYWSPMSIGSWGLMVFSGFAFLAFLGALYDAGWLAWRPLRALRRPGLKILIALFGGLGGLFLAGYTGVLLSVTNRPLWADTTWLGVLFLLSGASTAAVLLTLLALGSGARTRATVDWLSRLDVGTLVLELVALVALAISLGAVLRIWLSGWGVLLLLGVIGAGMLVPLALHGYPRLLGRLSKPTAATLVLIGGFLLRLVVVFSSEGV
jgi:formate-dependent nitrite reductase membrane component NrfD